MSDQSLFTYKPADFALTDRSTPVDSNSPVDPIDPAEITILDDVDVINPDISDTYYVDEGEVFDLGLLDTDLSGVVEDDLTNRSLVDYYDFTVDQSNDFSFALDGLSADADLYLFDENGEVLGASENYDFEAEALEGTLAEGTYSLGVFSYDNVATDYELTISSGQYALSSMGVDSSADFMSQEFSLM